MKNVEPIKNCLYLSICIFIMNKHHDEKKQEIALIVKGTFTEKVQKTHSSANKGLHILANILTALHSLLTMSKKQQLQRFLYSFKYISNIFLRIQTYIYCCAALPKQLFAL